QAVTARLVAHLDGQPLPPPVRHREMTPPALTQPLTATTVIPPGQRCTQQLRRYFTDVIGSSFFFDASMRDFIASGTGQTLGAAVHHWHATRAQPATEIGCQFEFNIFIRGWHQQHRDKPRTEALDAWRLHRALPAEARHRPR
ncbi:MAG: DUF6434 domain-containing protein, partial [Microlunatus sp.]|nr:DUF6434 domain-containing protein [Microlunatus sp.]